ncbi:hypothetical protein ASPVEDRAFT_141141 [Aspergillus versicolor CBS 583.65]|uniref:Rhodopsin domain-containing protein n=1 Tax=Aspergillus versicolor CBS 583.65 TaxID=1036611 RepID=A0A1L9PZV4_ASPVE|nr:uncharacterized protein ASPVEDRAFT_141141 [Aspergillus versicolor CBS 583.65]OJJ07025.1 hypothetical protein ASPVEDRAFT_141141 [Aspergillus versicolor CBS 583.65]
MAGNADSLQPWTVATVSAVTVLAFVAVCLRLLARFERKQKLWWDDWMIIWSMVRKQASKAWNFVVVGFIFAMHHNGMGLHANTLHPNNVVLIAKFLVVAEILYAFNLVWTKLSILFFYYRIFHLPYFKRWAYAIAIFVIAWVICVTFLFIFICVPVQKLWYPQLPGHCINQVGTWIANAISTIASDLAILILPLPQIWKLQLRAAEKAALTFAFSLGFFVVFASAYRFSVLFSYTALDSSYTLAPTVGWTAIEMSAGIVSACLPTLRPAFAFFFRVLGLRSVMPSLLRTGGSRTASTSKLTLNTAGHSHSHSRSRNGNGNGGGGSASAPSNIDLVRANRRSFYHLPDDESDSLDSQTRVDGGQFRPGYDSMKTKTVVHGREREEMEAENERWLKRTRDDVPLKGIRVQTEFTQHEF